MVWQNATNPQICLAEGLIAYVEWAPLTRVRGSGLIGACGYLLSMAEHRLAAATVLRELSSRKQLQVALAVPTWATKLRPMDRYSMARCRVDMETLALAIRPSPPSWCQQGLRAEDTREV